MEVHFTPELEQKLNALAVQTGRAADELVQDAVAGFVDELVATREMLDNRYHDLESGRVRPIDGEEFFESLRRRENDLFKSNNP